MCMYIYILCVDNFMLRLRGVRKRNHNYDVKFSSIVSNIFLLDIRYKYSIEFGKRGLTRNCRFFVIYSVSGEYNL